ncbi:MAG: hypothetical protein R2822_15370 [Spirosomataceae bacterium]
MKSDYSTVAGYLRPIVFEFQTKYLPFEVWDSLALMLLGLALFKWGFLTGGWSNNDYWKVVKIGYGLGLPLVIYANYYASITFSTLEANLASHGASAYQLDQPDLSFSAYFVGDGPCRFVDSPLQIGHDTRLDESFGGCGAHGFYQLYLALGHLYAILLWLRAQLLRRIGVLSNLSCRAGYLGFSANYQPDMAQILFGPLEWLWRSLTYWKVQPFKR